ncbi:MAG: hypothetical protein H7201_03040 [Candidatus Saccharibacteria bacterium]|nr:hypothetical protein [Microbacteriaceae bacterium]
MQSRSGSPRGLTLVWFDRLTSREDGIVERSRVSIQLLLKEQKPRLALTLTQPDSGTRFGHRTDRMTSAHENHASHSANEPKEILRSRTVLRAVLRDNGANARNTPRPAQGERVAQKDSKKKLSKKASGKKKLVKAAKSERKKDAAKSEKKAARAAGATAKKAVALKKTAPAKKAAPARDVAPATKAPATRVRRTPAPKPAEPSLAWTVVALRAHARAAGIVGYSRMKKDELLEGLRAH